MKNADIGKRHERSAFACSFCGVQTLVAVAVLGGAASVSAAAVTACLAFAGKAREEKRLAELAVMEADTRITGSFASLMGRAHGRGDPLTADGVVAILLAEGAFVDELRRLFADEVTGAAGAAELGRAYQILDRLLRQQHSVGIADMDATLQVIGSLGLRHSVLTRAARIGIEGRHQFQRVAEYQELVTALRAKETSDTRRAGRHRIARTWDWILGR
ncbi:hypothetical protein [Embleya sp. NPDC001921]